MPADTPATSLPVTEVLAREFPEQAAHMPAILGFLDADVPVPFLCRFRKEKIGGVSEERLRAIRDRRRELIALEKLRNKAIAKLTEAGLLTDEMAAEVARASSPAGIRDLTCALEPDLRPEEDAAAEDKFGALASAILNADAGLTPEELAAPFVSEEKGVPDVDAALGGAVRVLAQRFFSDPAARGFVRRQFLASGRLRARLRPEADPQKKYETYHDFTQSLSAVPSHRVLAVLRGAREKVLDVQVELDGTQAVAGLSSLLLEREDHPNRGLLERAVAESFEAFYATRMAAEMLDELKVRADREATRIFVRNLRQLLTLPPAGDAVVMGVDPGVRRGCKIAVVDAGGVSQRHASIYPFAETEKNDGTKKAVKTVGDFCRQYGVQYIALGSGPGCREVERFLREAFKEDESVTAKVVVVNDAGTAAYATGAVGKEEFPKLDTRVRSAVSLARRLKDPLREMAKVKPTSINVGPYQREVDKRMLSRALDEVVESCVALVGADLNRDPETVLRRVPAIGPKEAKAVVARREESGPLKSSRDLLEVEGFDVARWTLCSGFLRISDAENPLERIGIHPEAHALVETMAEKLGIEPGDLVGNDQALGSLDPEGFVGEETALSTVEDVFHRLRTAGADPRGVFAPPSFRDDLNVLGDLEVGMVLEGVVTNLASFGAFVDVGVDQEGLIHVSELSDGFVEDAGAIVSVGERVKVRVLTVDPERKRLSLSRRTPGARRPAKGGGRREGKRPSAAAGGGARTQTPGARTQTPGARSQTPGARPQAAGARPADAGRGRAPARGDRRGKDRDRKGRDGGREDRDRSREPRKPMIHEQKAARAPEPEIDPDLPEDEQFRLKLDRLRKKFENGR